MVVQKVPSIVLLSSKELQEKYPLKCDNATLNSHLQKFQQTSKRKLVNRNPRTATNQSKERSSEFETTGSTINKSKLNSGTDYHSKMMRPLRITVKSEGKSIAYESSVNQKSCHQPVRDKKRNVNKHLKEVDMCGLESKQIIRSITQQQMSTLQENCEANTKLERVNYTKKFNSITSNICDDEKQTDDNCEQQMTTDEISNKGIASHNHDNIRLTQQGKQQITTGGISGTNSNNLDNNHDNNNSQIIKQQYEPLLQLLTEENILPDNLDSERKKLTNKNIELQDETNQKLTRGSNNETQDDVESKNQFIAQSNFREIGFKENENQLYYHESNIHQQQNSLHINGRENDLGSKNSENDLNNEICDIIITEISNRITREQGLCRNQTGEDIFCGTRTGTSHLILEAIQTLDQANNEALYGEAENLKNVDDPLTRESSITTNKNIEGIWSCSINTKTGDDACDDDQCVESSTLNDFGGVVAAAFVDNTKNAKPKSSKNSGALNRGGNTVEELEFTTSYRNSNIGKKLLLLSGGNIANKVIEDRCRRFIKTNIDRNLYLQEDTIDKVDTDLDSNCTNFNDLNGFDIVGGALDKSIKQQNIICSNSERDVGEIFSFRDQNINLVNSVENETGNSKAENDTKILKIACANTFLTEDLKNHETKTMRTKKLDAFLTTNITKKHNIIKKNKQDQGNYKVIIKSRVENVYENSKNIHNTNIKNLKNHNMKKPNIHKTPRSKQIIHNENNNHSRNSNVEKVKNNNTCNTKPKRRSLKSDPFKDYRMPVLNEHVIGETLLEQMTEIYETNGQMMCIQQQENQNLQAQEKLQRIPHQNQQQSSPQQSQEQKPEEKFTRAKNISAKKCPSLNLRSTKPLKICHMRRLSAPIKFQEFQPTTTNSSCAKTLNFQEVIEEMKDADTHISIERKHLCRATFNSDLTICKRKPFDFNDRGEHYSKTRSQSVDVVMKPFIIQKVNMVSIETLKSFSCNTSSSSDNLESSGLHSFNNTENEVSKKSPKRISCANTTNSVFTGISYSRKTAQNDFSSQSNQNKGLAYRTSDIKNYHNHNQINEIGADNIVNSSPYCQPQLTCERKVISSEPTSRRKMRLDNVANHCSSGCCIYCRGHSENSLSSRKVNSNQELFLTSPSTQETVDKNNNTDRPCSCGKTQNFSNDKIDNNIDADRHYIFDNKTDVNNIHRTDKSSCTNNHNNDNYVNEDISDSNVNEDIVEISNTENINSFINGNNNNKNKCPRNIAGNHRNVTETRRKLSVTNFSDTRTNYNSSIPIRTSNKTSFSKNSIYTDLTSNFNSRPSTTTIITNHINKRRNSTGCKKTEKGKMLAKDVEKPLFLLSAETQLYSEAYKADISDLESINGMTLNKNRSSIIMLTSATECCQTRRKQSTGNRKLSLPEYKTSLTKSFEKQYFLKIGKAKGRIENCLDRKTKRSSHDQYSEYTTEQAKTPPAKFPINIPDIHHQFPTQRLDSKSSSPTLNRCSKSTEESPVNMRISEQDLGSDADSLPSCGESLTASESPPNSPELFKPKTEVTRRESAPASINLEALQKSLEMEIEKNQMKEQSIRELHRRYSSVEERTNRVRFKLQESFQEEEERYNKQFNEQDVLERKFSDIEPYKIPPSHYPRKISSPPCFPSEIEENVVSNKTPERKTSSDRSRKCSVFSDNSGSIQILPGQSVRRVTSHENIIENVCPKENSRKISLQEHKLTPKEASENDRKLSLQEITRKRCTSVYEKKDEQANRKHSLQGPKRRTSFCDRKLSLQERKDSTMDQIAACVNRKLSHGVMSERTHSSIERKLSETDRKFSAADRKLSTHERKLSLNERKLSLNERKLSLNERKPSLNERKFSSTERKYSSTERKHSSTERKLSQEVRKVSLTDTLRSVVGTKKKHERKQSQETLADENNNLSNDKKSAWGLIKNKIKKDRKTSNEILLNGSPRMLRLLSRHDSSSSVESGTPRGRRRSSKRLSRNEDYDQKSISSFNSLDLDDSGNETQQIVPNCAFDVWAEGKAEINLENKTLPLLHVAAAEGNTDLLKTLLDVGVDINELDASGWPALHYAVCSGNFECAQLLLEKGATLQNYSNKVMNTYCTAVRDCIRTGSFP